MIPISNEHAVHQHRIVLTSSQSFQDSFSFLCPILGSRGCWGFHIWSPSIYCFLRWQGWKGLPQHLAAASLGALGRKWKGSLLLNNPGLFIFYWSVSRCWSSSGHNVNMCFWNGNGKAYNEISNWEGCGVVVGGFFVVGFLLCWVFGCGLFF